MKERLYLWAWRVIFVYCAFFLMSGVVSGAEEGFDNPYVKQVEITNVDRDGHEQSTLVKVIFNSLPDSVEDLIDYMEFRDSNGEVYQFYPEEFYSIYSYDFYLKELPFSLPDGEIEFTLYDSEGIEYEYLMQQAKDRTVRVRSSSLTSFSAVLDVIDSFDSPGPLTGGLAFDGTYLWNADVSDGKIYKLDTSGNIITSFDSPGSSPTGLAFDGTYLWNSDVSDDKIYKLDTSGNIITSFDSPGSLPEGLAFDGTYLWHANCFPGKIYKLDTSGNIITSFDPPGLMPTGLAFDGTYLWNADAFDDKIYKLDTSGNIITSFDSPGSLTRGLAFDGTYLWNSDVSDDKIYKLRIEVGPPSLSYIRISGLIEVNENSGAQYSCTAYYSDGSSSTVTSSAIWSENSSYASINSSGYLTTTSVSSDQSCTITASYGGKSDTHSVIILTEEVADSDGDGIFDDGDSSGTVGDNPCTGGETENCDDNCLYTYNPSQADSDGDGVGDVCDVGTDGYMVTSDLWIRAVINTVEKGPIEAVWKKGGEDTTSRGDRVIWGHFYASPSDVTWGSENNPDLFVKIWFDVSGRVDVNYFHVSVPEIEVYSDYHYDGSPDEQGTTTMERRYIRQYYEGGQSYSEENYEDGDPPTGYWPTGNPFGYSTINDLRIGSMINTVEKGPIDAIWQLGGLDTTARGDQVVWGHFYASPSDVTWGSENNPDLFVKIWFDVSGRVDVNFFHVSVPDIEVYSDLPDEGTYDQQGTTIMDNRYIRHEYIKGENGGNVEFCRQVNNYEAGYGVEGVDEIIVITIQGPEGATVSNQKNGEYIVNGTYKLGTFNTATISLNWGGSTSYSLVEDYEINPAGEGSFTVRVIKESGGSGNLFLSMASGSKWMFDAIPVNTLCSSTSSISLKALPEVSKTFLDYATNEDNILVREVPWTYFEK